MVVSAGRLTYTADAVAGAATGWQVKESIGLDADEIRHVLATVTPLTLPERPSPFLSSAQAEQLPRRLSWKSAPGGGWVLSHTVYAGQDASRRPDNSFTDAVLIRNPAGPDLLRPIDRWRSPGWTTPYGASAVASAVLPREMLPPAGDSVSATAALAFLADPARDDSSATLQLLLDAVAGCVRGGPPVVLVTETVDFGAQWLAAVSYHAPAAFAQFLSFSTYERPRALADSVPARVVVLIRSELEPGQLRGDLADRFIVVDDEVEPDETADRQAMVDAAGRSVPRTLWSRVASFVGDLGVADAVEVLALLDSEDGSRRRDASGRRDPRGGPLGDADPGQALAQAVLDSPRMEWVAEQVRELRDGFRTVPVQEKRLEDETRRVGAREGWVPRLAGPSPGAAWDAVVRAEIAIPARATDVASALVAWLGAVGSSLDWLVDTRAHQCAPVRTLRAGDPGWEPCRDAADRLLRSTIRAGRGPVADLYVLDLLVRCGLLTGPDDDEMAELCGPLVGRVVEALLSPAAPGFVSQLDALSPATVAWYAYLPLSARGPSAPPVVGAWLARMLPDGVSGHGTGVPTQPRAGNAVRPGVGLSRPDADAGAPTGTTREVPAPAAPSEQLAGSTEMAVTFLDAALDSPLGDPGAGADVLEEATRMRPADVRRRESSVFAQALVVAAVQQVVLAERDPCHPDVVCGGSLSTGVIGLVGLALPSAVEALRRMARADADLLTDLVRAWQHRLLHERTPRGALAGDVLVLPSPRAMSARPRSARPMTAPPMTGRPISPPALAPHLHPAQPFPPDELSSGREPPSTSGAPETVGARLIAGILDDDRLRTGQLRGQFLAAARAERTRTGVSIDRLAREWDEIAATVGGGR